MRVLKMKRIINRLLILSLLVAFVSGLVLKTAPGMWTGILHGVSGLVLFICAVIHGIQYGAAKRRQNRLSD